MERLLGPKARIIGIDLNPRAKKWEKEGFEIHIGSQSDPAFWKAFFESVGPVDVVLDDGGHTYVQQIVTVHSCMAYTNEGGMVVVEDTHTSYLKEFGYPTKYSFIEWTKRLIDNINSRFPEVNASNLPYKESVYSITIFESFVSFKIHRNKCFESTLVTNGGLSLNAEDFRYNDTNMGGIDGLMRKLTNRFPLLKEARGMRSLRDMVFGRYSAYTIKRRLDRLGKFFQTPLILSVESSGLSGT